MTVKRTLTQQGAFRKDRNAINRAEQQKVSDKELINQMAATHSHPNTPGAFADAAGTLIHLRANMNKEIPVSDALDAILEQRNAPQPGGTPQPV